MFTTEEMAISWIHGARYTGAKHGLENTRALLAELGDPQRHFRSIHVAGTNGKGSTCCLIERALREGGFCTGLYTSPFLVKYNERMRVNGRPIAAEELCAVAGEVYQAAQRLEARGLHPTSFELGTAVAFCFFRRAGVEWAVVEVGLGGRLDPTNVLEPQVCAVASIGLDHMQILGNTVEAIAAEKAGIVKPGVPLVIEPQISSVRAVFERACREAGAPLVDLGEGALLDIEEDERRVRFSCSHPQWGRCALALGLAGRHQAANGFLALGALRALQARGLHLSEEALARGFAQAVWPGRLEWVGAHPAVLLDGAHNPQGAEALAGFVGRQLEGRRKVLLTAMMGDKQVEASQRLLCPLADAAVATQPGEPRAMPAGQLAGLLERLGVRTEAEPYPARALERARALAGPQGVVIACGSLYLVGELRALLLPGDDGSI